MKVALLCPIPCDPMDYTVHGILQTRILEWVAFPFSRGSSQPKDRTQVSTLQADSLPAEPQGKLKRVNSRAENGERLTQCWEFRTSVKIKVIAGLGMDE